MLLSCLRGSVYSLLVDDGHILWRRYIFVLAIEAVFSAKLAGSCFVALLLAGATMVASLGSSNLLSSYLSLARSGVVTHVWARSIGNWLTILLAWWGRWRMIGLVIGMRGTDTLRVPIRDAAIGSVVTHGPRPLVAAMLHFGRRFDVNGLRCGR